MRSVGGSSEQHVRWTDGPVSWAVGGDGASVEAMQGRGRGSALGRGMRMDGGKGRWIGGGALDIGVEVVNSRQGSSDLAGRVT